MIATLQAPGAQAPSLHADAAPDARHGFQLPTLTRYWRVAVRWRYVIAGIVAGFLILGLLVTLLMTPKYTGSATIEISRQQDKIVQVQDVRPESSAVDLEFYQTQYALLRSRSLAEVVVDKLGLADNRGFLDMFGVDIDDKTVLLSQSNGPLPTQQRAERRKKAAKALLEHVGVNPTRGSRLVEVTFSSPDPVFSSQVANAWTEQFIETNLARRFDASSYARRFLEGRLVDLKARLEQSERLLVNYAAEQRIITIPSSERSGVGDRPIVGEDLATINQALAVATTDRVKAQSRLIGTGSVAGTEEQPNATLSVLRQKRAEAAADYAKLLVQFEPGYPPAKALGAQLKTLDGSISKEEGRAQQAVREAADEARIREAGLQRRVQTLKEDLIDLKRRSIQYNIYQRDVDTNRQLYDALLQRYKEIGVAGGVGTNNVAVVDPAQVPDKPSSPKIWLNLLLALLTGSIVAGALALALEQIDEAIKEPSEASRATGLAMLGTVPAVAGADPIALLRDRKSEPSEAYLSIQTNLEFATDHGVPRTLAVTSTRAGEGKSTTSYAIAASLTRTGRKIILVDCDMRSPSVHELAGLSNNRGTSSFLAGDDNLVTMIQGATDPDLAVLAAGATPPNAADLLSGPRFALLIERLSGMFDHVIIDAPPVVGLADAPLIGGRVEGVLYVVEAHGPRATVVRSAIERLRSAHANIIGAVLTKFETRKAHFGYGYEYGYGYGKEDG